MMTGAHIRVVGRVQGVGFRYFAMRHANDYGLKGYVKNLADGSVEVRVEGEKDVIKHYTKILEEGPGYSLVDYVDFSFEPYTAKFQKFSVEY
jgi:acylphosphatase